MSTIKKHGHSIPTGLAGRVASDTAVSLGQGTKAPASSAPSSPAPALQAPALQPAELSGALATGASSTSSSSGAAARKLELEQQVPDVPKKRGPKAEMLPEVSRVFEQYGVDKRLGRPRERLGLWVARIHDGMMAAGAGGADTKALADQMLKNDVRLDVFYLEGMLKLYTGPYPELEGVFEEVKALEDALGAASGARSALAMVEKHPNIPDEAVAWMREQVAVTDERLVSLLDKSWVPDDKGRLPALHRTVKALKKADWDDYKDDRNHLEKELNRRLKKFEKTELDVSVLQGDTGLHELRRQLRWLPIYAVALDGVFTFSDERNPIPEYAALLKTDLVDNKYAKLPPSLREKDPIEFSHSLYLKNTALIYEVGKLKDAGEEIEAVGHALQGAGLVPDAHHAMAEAERLLGLPADAEESILAKGKAIYDDLKAVGYIRALRDEVRGR